MWKSYGQSTSLPDNFNIGKGWVMSAVGLHRVLEPAGVLPQAATRLDTAPAIRPDEVRIAVERLNLDAASFRQLREEGGDVRARVRGGKNDDNLTLNVNLATATDTAAIDALLDGGKGFDTCLATANVVVKSCEA